MTSLRQMIFNELYRVKEEINQPNLRWNSSDVSKLTYRIAQLSVDQWEENIREEVSLLATKWGWYLARAKQENDKLIGLAFDSCIIKLYEVFHVLQGIDIHDQWHDQINQLEAIVLTLMQSQRKDW